MLDSNKPVRRSGICSAADQYTELAALAGGLAHEIKNPLSTIRLNMELLAEDFADSDRTVDRRALAKIQLVQSECTRLENLLNDFLRFAAARAASSGADRFERRNHAGARSVSAQGG